MTTIWADGGFDEPAFMQWVMDHCRWIVEIVPQLEQPKGFLGVCLAKKTVGGRTHVQLMGCRRLVRDCELLLETSETLIYLAMIRIMVRRLA